MQVTRYRVCHFLEILSGTQQIVEEVNVQRGINLLADGTCHHDRTGKATNRKKAQLVRGDAENKPNIVIKMINLKSCHA